MAERLQKWLAARGVASRRQVEQWISAGRITIDGRPAVPGATVSGGERIRLDGRPLRLRRREDAQGRVLLYHKPAGEICTRRDPQGRPTVFERLPKLRGARWISVGRLDVQTSGLLLFTTDGELANRLMHPAAGLAREYAVRVQGGLDDAALARLRAGVELEDGPARCLQVEFTGGDGGNRWYRIVLAEGRNRVVRRLIERLGGRVSRLIRVRYGPVRLPRDLPRGEFRELAPAERERLYEAAGLREMKLSRSRRYPARRRRSGR